MWESHGFNECANNNVLVASDGTGGSRDTPKCLRKVAFGVAFSLHVLSRTSFEVQRIGFLCGLVPGRHTVPRAERLGAIQALIRVDVKTTIQLPIDAKYVTKGVTQRDELEYGPTGDLVNSFSIERRAQWQNRSHQGQVTLGGCWPISDPARRLLFITCWRTLWRTTLSEEAAKSLLPDMTFDQKAERAERTGVSRLGLLETAVLSTLSSFEETGWRDRQHKSSTREAQERFEVSGMQHLSCL